MEINGILTIIALVVVLIVVLNTKAFKVWSKGVNKTEYQKKAIKFLIYGPDKSKITVSEYDEICTKMYSDSVLYEKAQAKLGFSDADVVRHPCDTINSEYLCVTNFSKADSDALVCELGGNDFRSSKLKSLMVVFGREKLYVYQLKYRSDKTEEYEVGHEYSYEELRYFKVEGQKVNDETVSAIVSIVKNASEKDSVTHEYKSFVMSNDKFKQWVAVGKHLDSPELKKECSKKSKDIEKKVLRYFKAHDNLPLAITDDEYDSMIAEALPSEELRLKGMDQMGIEDHDINLAEPMSFRSFVYDNGAISVQGSDKSWRSSVPQHTWLFFGKHQVYVYITSFHMDSSILQEATQEIFYNDIASTRSEQMSKEEIYGDIKYTLSYYKFTLLFAGDGFSLTLPYVQGDNDRKIKAMRNLLRETKNQSTPKAKAEDAEML